MITISLSTQWWEENCPAHEEFEGQEHLKQKDQETVQKLVEGLKTVQGSARKGSKKSQRQEESSESEEDEKQKKGRSRNIKKGSESDDTSQSPSESESGSNSEEENPPKKAAQNKR